MKIIEVIDIICSILFIVLTINLIIILISSFIKNNKNNKNKKLINDDMVSDLIRKLAEANSEIYFLLQERKEFPMFLSNYNALENYLHSFGVSYNAYYGTSSISGVYANCYIIDILGDDEGVMFQIALPDVIKNNPEGKLTLYNFSEGKVVGTNYSFEGISKYINSKMMMKQATKEK
jgi:hypothetical protein